MIEHHIRLADKIKLTRDQIKDVGLSTLKSYAENKPFNKNSFIDL